MKGRRPKDPELRRRRNKAVTAAVLEADEKGERADDTRDKKKTSAERKAPPLPKRLFPGSQVHALTRSWWRVIWRSPMSSRWLPADVEGLYLVAVLRDAFFRTPSPTLAAEIRQQEARFGLDVLSRRRLDWRIAGPIDAPPEEPPADEEPEAPPPDRVDPRSLLRAVK